MNLNGSTLPTTDKAARDAARTAAEWQRTERTRAATIRGALEGAAAAIERLNASGSYSNATKSRLRHDAPRLSGSPDWHLDPTSRAALLRDSRHLVRNNCIARAMIERLVDSIIGGVGVTFQFRSGSKEWNASAESAIRDWFEEEADARGLIGGVHFQRAVLRTVFVDGDMGFVKRADGRCQAVEAERLVNPGGTADDPEKMVGGIELRNGWAVAYHVAGWGRWGGYVDPTAPMRIPAEFFCYLSSPRFFNQTRGEPRLCATVDRFEQLDQYIEAEVVTARIRALFAVLIKSMNPGLMQQAMLGENEDADDEGGTGQRRLTDLYPGMIAYLQPGEAIEQVKAESPPASHRDFVRTQLRLIGADAGLPLEALLLDYSEPNFHASKSALAQAYRGFEPEQRWMGSRCLRPLIRWRTAMFVRQGVLSNPPDDWDRVSFTPPPRPVFEREAEAQAQALEIANNFNTLRSVLEENGKELDDVIAERAAEIALLEAAGLPTAPRVSGSPEAPPKDGADQADKPDGEEPDEPDGSEEPDAEPEDRPMKRVRNTVPKAKPRAKAKRKAGA